MKNEELISKLTYGVFICSIVGFVFSISIGVKDKTIYNYLIGASNCLLLTFINCILMLIETSKSLKKELNIKNILIKAIPYSIFAFVVGIIYILIVDKIFNVDICKISRFITALYQMFAGIMISTILANDAITRYIENEKNPKRKIKEKNMYE